MLVQKNKGGWLLPCKVFAFVLYIRVTLGGASSLVYWCVGDELIPIWKFLAGI